ncbi:hypothetical protein [Pleomorphovibrio marinus]|uniref:hypothetical protein n=1 Tax=Pleomorphovibrio marinus TaxID=2164132 RepID=UPI000E0B590F|nr:hypothetical protein [Pleomorphovibrio marinus]
MKFLVGFIIAALLALILGPLVPYWGLMVFLAILGATIRGNGFIVFFSSALGVGIVWLLVPLVLWTRSGSDLPQMLGEIFGINNGALLLGISAAMGFLIGGLSALSGCLFGKLLVDRNTYY